MLVFKNFKERNLTIENKHQNSLLPRMEAVCVQLFRQRLSKKSVKAYATMPKGRLGILNKF